ncbi:hypothetical protein SDC9_66309 [bioreactor metagenome]|uniref:Uncharacterized protein n=1 Tax=bioreactor metagenome TaxID=1076179 RepID=A0A644XUJ0_9ZZZZ
MVAAASAEERCPGDRSGSSGPGRRSDRERASIRVQRGVQLHGAALPGPHLHGAGERVADEEQAVLTGQLGRLGGSAVGKLDLGAGGDVQAGLDHAVVTQRDADPGVGAEQAALADDDAFLAAARQGAHDGRAAADVGAVVDDNTLGDAPLHHRMAQRAGVEVHEALVHDGGALGQMGTEPGPVGIGEAYATRDDIVDHPRELVDREHRDVTLPSPQPRPGGLEVVDGTRAGRGPHDVRQHAEDTVQVERVGPDQGVTEQVQAQVGVGGVGRRRVQVDHGEHRLCAHPACLVRHQARRHRLRRGRAVGLAERRCGIPGVQDLTGGVDGGQTPPVGRTYGVSHGPDSTESGPIPPAPCRPPDRSHRRRRPSPGHPSRRPVRAAHPALTGPRRREPGAAPPLVRRALARRHPG